MEKHLGSIAKWGKITGYLFIIFGAIYAVLGIFTSFGISSIPGVIQVFLGLYLLRTGKEADILLREYNEGALSSLVDNYAKFLRLNGIMAIIGIIFIIGGILLSVGLWVSIASFYQL